MLAALLLRPPLDPPRWRLPAALVLVVLALVLPIAEMGHPFTQLWNATGLPGSLLLLSYLLLVSGGLTRLSKSSRANFRPSRWEHATNAAGMDLNKDEN